MKRIILWFLTIFILLGCVPNPRYRTGGSLPPEQKKSPTEETWFAPNPNDRFEKLTTEELLYFGQIMQSYLGRPRNEKWDRSEALDCSRFTAEVFQTFNGTRLPRTAEQQYAEGLNVSQGRLRFGDLVFFRTEGRVISHVGIYVGYDEFIHSSSSTGVIISKMDDKYWKKRFAGARRILE